MTFKNKLLQDHPEYVHDRYLGGCKGCPADYGYEKEKPCKANHNIARDCKRHCWGREIPEK